MQTENSNQLNDYVRPVLAQYMNGSYQLNNAGQDRVIAANAALDKQYAEEHYLPVDDWCSQEIKGFLDLLPPDRYDTLLDMCAGTGYACLNIMRTGLFKKAVAFDINGQALKILQERASEMGLKNIETRCGNVMKTDFPDNTFDCVVGNSFLHHLPDCGSFLTEVFRILKPGGVLCLTCEPGLSTWKWENRFPTLIKGLIGKTHRPDPNTPLTDIWQFEEKSLTDLLQRIGYKNVLIHGRGRWTHALFTFLDRLTVRFTGRSAPSILGYIAWRMRRIGDRFMSRRPADQLAVLCILAKKGQ